MSCRGKEPPLALGEEQLVRIWGDKMSWDAQGFLSEESLVSGLLRYFQKRVNTDSSQANILSVTFGFLQTFVYSKSGGCFYGYSTRIAEIQLTEL